MRVYDWLHVHCYASLFTDSSADTVCVYVCACAVFVRVRVCVLTTWMFGHEKLQVLVASGVPDGSLSVLFCFFTTLFTQVSE